MFFYFLKIIFDISTSKRFKRYKPHSILAKKKKSNLKETQVQTHYQMFPKLFQMKGRANTWDYSHHKTHKNNAEVSIFQTG